MFTDYSLNGEATYGAPAQGQPQGLALPAPAEQAALFLSRLTAKDRSSRWFLPHRTSLPGAPSQWAQGSQRTGVHAGAELHQAAAKAIASGGDCYVSVNGFCGNRRTQQGLRQVVALFFDIDVVRAHVSGSMDGADAAKDAALALIESAVAQGRFPEPTMAVDTGRGLQLHLVLDRSCSARKADGTPNAALLQHVGRLQSKLLALLEDVLADICYLVDVDRSCTDLTRLCRLPGSWNSKAGCRAKLVTAAGPEHSLDALRGYVHFAAAPEKPSKPASARKKAKPASTLPASAFEGGNPLVSARAAAIEALQSARRRRGEDLGYRNEMVWAFMNNLFNVMPIEQAHLRTLELNARFSQPLPQSELMATMRCLKRRGAPYRVSNARLAEHMGMSQEEADETGFMASCTSRAAERRLMCKATAKRKAERNALILSLAATGMVYADIAEKAGCSKRTVSSVLAANNAARRASKKSAESAPTARERAAAEALAGQFGRSSAIPSKNAFIGGISAGVPTAGEDLADTPVSTAASTPQQGVSASQRSCKKLSSYSCAWSGARAGSGPVGQVIHIESPVPIPPSELSTTQMQSAGLSTPPTLGNPLGSHPLQLLPSQAEREGVPYAPCYANRASVRGDGPGTLTPGDAMGREGP